jgi:hypothetical protein
MYISIYILQLISSNILHCFLTHQMHFYWFYIFMYEKEISFLQVMWTIVQFLRMFLHTYIHIYITHLPQQCHNSKCAIFQERLLKALKCYNFPWVQQRHNCSPAASFANCVMTLYLLKVHLQTFLSITITQKCQILSCDTLVSNKRYIYIYMYHQIYIYICVCVCVCIYICIYIWWWPINRPKLVNVEDCCVWLNTEKTHLVSCDW